MPIIDKEEIEKMGKNIPMHWQEKKIILSSFGWGFPVDGVFGNVCYYRAISPNGWLSVIERDSTDERNTIERAWALHQQLVNITGDIVTDWYKEHGERVGLLYDPEKKQFTASFQDKVRGISVIKEATGDSPTEAVMVWNSRYRNT